MYTLTFCDTDGHLVAVVPGATALPRFLHARHNPDGNTGTIELSDDPTASDDDEAAFVTTFARVASSVWVHDEEFNCEDRAALFVRVAA